jgi:hypothetical protein
VARRDSSPLYSPRAAIGVYGPKRALQRKLAREMREGNKLWSSIGAALWVGGIIRRSVSRREDVAAVERLKPGQELHITTIAVPSRRQRRKAARQAADRG